jgi:predicted PolB exonuclease-like 3'-5' exonuclease
MIKSFSSKTCAFDVEWVPCAATARRLLALDAALDEASCLQAVWAHYGDEQTPRPFLKLALSKVVSIAAVLRNVERNGNVHLALYQRTTEHDDEAAVIQAFLEMVAGEAYQLWGFNSSNADLPLLKQRAIALGVPCPCFSSRPDKPWNGYDYHDARNSEAHRDILQLVSAYGRTATPSLNELAAACGLPGKLGVTGNDVAELYLNGGWAKILAYNTADALTTHALMLRIGLHSGKLTPAQYARDMAAVDELVAPYLAQTGTVMGDFAATWADGRRSVVTS